MTDFKPDDTPIASRAQLSNQDGTPLLDPIEFRHLLGFLQYLTFPDIAYTVNHIFQVMSCPTQTHLTIDIRIIFYVKGTREQGISFRRSSGPPLLHGDSDAN